MGAAFVDGTPVWRELGGYSSSSHHLLKVLDLGPMAARRLALHRPTPGLVVGDLVVGMFDLGGWFTAFTPAVKPFVLACLLVGLADVPHPAPLPS